MALDPLGPDPEHPSIGEHPLRGMDLSGGTSTIANEPGFTTGRASKARALINATAPPNSSSAKSLLEQYRLWKERQAAAEAEEQGLANDVEDKALRKSRKTYKKHVQSGISAPVATSAAFSVYRSHGGQAELPAWARRFASQP